MNIDSISGRGHGVGAAGGVNGGGSTRGVSGETGNSADFASILGDAIAGVAGQLRQAEATSISNINGVASTQDVVEQVMSAEQSLQACLAVRDKIVGAYLEISRMTI